MCNAFQVPLPPVIPLVNENAQIVERKKNGVFLTRPVSNLPLAFLRHRLMQQRHETARVEILSVPAVVRLPILHSHQSPSLATRRFQLCRSPFPGFATCWLQLRVLATAPDKGCSLFPSLYHVERPQRPAGSLISSNGTTHAPLTDSDPVTRIKLSGRNRLALTDWGLSVLARRDRASVGMARKGWSVYPRDRKAALTWQDISGKRNRQLARNMEHTEAVHRFFSYLANQARSLKYRVVQFDPPHRTTRYLRHEDKLRSIHPDAFSIMRKGDNRQPFFLEWEYRAV